MCAFKEHCGSKKFRNSSTCCVLYLEIAGTCIGQLIANEDFTRGRS